MACCRDAPDIRSPREPKSRTSDDLLITSLSSRRDTVADEEKLRRIYDKVDGLEEAHSMRHEQVITLLETLGKDLAVILSLSASNEESSSSPKAVGRDAPLELDKVWLEEALPQPQGETMVALVEDVARTDSRTGFTNREVRERQPEHQHKLENGCVEEPDAEEVAEDEVADVVPGASKTSVRSEKTSTSKASAMKKRGQSTAMDNITGAGGPEIETGGILGMIEKLVKSSWFEILFSGLIMANTIVMCLESQYQGMNVGHDIEYFAYTRPARESWPGGTAAFEVLEWIFGIVFTLELILKVVGLRMEFMYDMWNIIDTLIVSSWILTAMNAVEFPLDPMMLRLCRLARLLRLLRIVRTIKGFDKLYLMTTAMKGSVTVLAWSIMLLAVVQAMLALFLQAMLEPYVSEDNPETLPGRKEVYKFYGTFARTMLTMFEITLGNWLPPCRALVENVDEWYMLFSLGHKMVIGFSVVAVLNGVFIQETFKVATMDDKVMVMQKERTARAHTTKMHELFTYVDKDGNGELDKDEFIDALEQPSIKQWLSAMELDVSDAGHIFDLVDVNGDGAIDAEELVKGAGRLKGPARSIDLVSMIRDQKQFQKDIQEIKAAMLAQGRSPRRSPTAGYS